MALEGSLKDFGLADIFQLIYHQKKTGILTMKNDATEAKVLFEDGLVLKAETANLEGLNKIGQILARSNKITEDKLKEALAKQLKSNNKIGEILIEMGAIQKEDLVKALGIHVREAVLALFKWKEGRYSFEPSDLSIERDYWVPVNTEFLIMEGVRRIDEWPFIEKTIPNLEIIFDKNKETSGNINVAKVAEDFSSDLAPESVSGNEIRITQEEKNLYDLVDGQHDVRHLIEISNMGEFETCKALSNLLTSGLITKNNVIDQPVTEHITGSGTPIIEPIKPQKRQIRIPGLNTRQMVSGVIIIASLLIMAGGGKKVIQSFQKSKEILSYSKRIEVPNRVQEIAHSILVYYYRNNELPKTLAALNEPVYTVSDMSNGEGGPVIGYEAQPGLGYFTLKASMDSVP